MKGKSLSSVRLLATPWTAAYQAPLSMGFSRQEYWSGVPLPSLGLNLWVAKILWRRERLPTPVFWPGEFHGLYSHGVTKSRTRLRNFNRGLSLTTELGIWQSFCTLSNWYLRRRQWYPTPVLLPGKPHGQGSLVGCSPWGR